MQKPSQKGFRVEKVIKNGDKLYFKWKGYNNSFNSWIDKKDIVWMSEYFPETKSSGGRVKIELDLPNYATKTDLKNATGVGASSFAKTVDLAHLWSDVDKLDSDKI